MEYAQLSSAKSSLEQQVAELQERLQERENEVAKQTERTKELEEALSDVQTDSKRAATEQISAKSANGFLVAKWSSLKCRLIASGDRLT